MTDNQSITKENIPDAAEGVLRRFGPRKANVVDVARALEVSRGTVYRHYGSKAELLEAAAGRWLHRVSEPDEVMVILLLLSGLRKESAR